MTPLELEHSKMRVSVESPVHGPKILAYVAELEALRAPAVAEDSRGLRHINVEDAPGYEHALATTCWCGPETVGVEVRHR